MTLLRFALIRPWRVACCAFGWGALATVVAGLPEWDVLLALRTAPILLGAALAGALPPALQAARAAPTELIRTVT
jgi:hypothetical protein